MSERIFTTIGPFIHFDKGDAEECFGFFGRGPDSSEECRMAVFRLPAYGRWVLRSVHHCDLPGAEPEVHWRQITEGQVLSLLAQTDGIERCLKAPPFWFHDLVPALNEAHAELTGSRPPVDMKDQGGPQGPVLCREDVAILTVLAGSKVALTVAQIVQAVDRLVLEEIKERRPREIQSVQESAVKRRISVLEADGLVARPLGKNGLPTQRKGIGITVEGRRRLAPQVDEPAIHK